MADSSEIEISCLFWFSMNLYETIEYIVICITARKIQLIFGRDKEYPLSSIHLYVLRMIEKDANWAFLKKVRR